MKFNAGFILPSMCSHIKFDLKHFSIFFNSLNTLCVIPWNLSGLMCFWRTNRRRILMWRRFIDYPFRFLSKIVEWLPKKRENINQPTFRAFYQLNHTHKSIALNHARQPSIQIGQSSKANVFRVRFLFNVCFCAVFCRTFARIVCVCYNSVSSCPLIVRSIILRAWCSPHQLKTSQSARRQASAPPTFLS